MKLNARSREVFAKTDPAQTTSPRIESSPSSRWNGRFHCTQYSSTFKGIQQCGSRRHLEAHATLRLRPQVHFHHTVTVRQLQLPSHIQREVDGHIPGTDQCSSRLLTVADHLPSGSRLDYEAGNIRQEDQHPVEIRQTAEGLELQ